jgi:hypothetical protein
MSLLTRGEVICSIAVTTILSQMAFLSTGLPSMEVFVMRGFLPLMKLLLLIEPLLLMGRTD